MSNNAKNVDYSSDEEEEESEDEEEEEHPAAAKPKPQQQQQARVQQLDRKPQEEEEEESSEEESETDNEADRYTTMRREVPPVGSKAAQSVIPVGKRGRDADATDEEPASKKSKDTKVEKAKVPVKAASPSRSVKFDPKAQVSKSRLVNKPSEQGSRPSGVTKKRKASPPPASNGGAKQRAEASPGKSKIPFTWTNNLEIALATTLHKEKVQGRLLSGSKNDPYWSKLAKEMGMQGISVTEAQLSEKVKRMKHKWKTYKEKEGSSPWKNQHERTLFDLWEATWGTGTLSGVQPGRPGVSRGAPHEDDEEESEDEELAPPAPGSSSRGPGQPNKKEESDESEEEEEEDEEPAQDPKKGGANQEGPSQAATAFSPTSVVSPFVSKPRLEYTPILPKDRKKLKKGEETSIAEQNGAEESGEEEGQDGRTPPKVAELLNSLKKESFSILSEVRAGCLEALNSIRQQTTTVLDDVKDVNGRFGIGMRMNSCRMTPVERNFLDDFLNNSLRPGTNTANSALISELKDQWRQLRVEEMDIMEKRTQLTLKHLQLARKVLQEQDN
ncbi:hypothetical protein R1flu_018433 [Riccia fluitans]|uniref:Myb-like domain-containing protein n=1 Tax=Riccia fluitans TaxID=41844 RepID=A0ABD1ZG55_9MARC